MSWHEPTSRLIMHILAGSRCRFTHDLEYVALDMLYVFPRDAGEYSVKVTNAAGSAVSTTTVYCFGKYKINIMEEHTTVK